MFRRFDAITLTLILIIMSFISTIAYIQNTNQDEKSFAHYHQELETLKFLQKDFETFLHTSLNFKNYDDISIQVIEFNTILTKIENSSLDDVYGNRIKEQIQDVRAAYTEEIDLLEYHKSVSAVTVNTIHYLFDLRKSIDNSSSISVKQKHDTNELLFLLIQHFSGVGGQENSIKKAIKKEQFNSDINVRHFYAQSVIFLRNIVNLQLPLQEHTEVALLEKVVNVMSSLEEHNKAALKRNEKLNLFFAFGLIVLLLILIYLHYRSLIQKEEMKLAASVFENIDEGIIVTDKDLKILSVNSAIQTMFGYVSVECLGNTPKIFKSKLHDEHFYEEMWYEINENGSWKGKLKDRTKEGTVVTTWVSISVVKDAQGKILNYISIHTNLEAIIKSQEKIDFLAYHDTLTQLPNRVSFEESIEHSIKLAHRKKTKLAILFIDLDRFKVINDTLGHYVGDELLKEVARKIRAVLRDVDMLARIGGDEFVVTIENIASGEEPAIVADKILYTLSQPIDALGHTLNTSASIGIACYPDNADDVVTLLKHADSAMYRAKELGKNRLNFFTEELSSKMRERLEIEQELRQAIKENELYLNFQPQYDMQTKSVVSAEALLRWNNKKLGIIGPDTFIPIAEDSGMIIEIGDFVFREACSFMRELKDKGHILERMAINVSSQQFQEANIVDKFKGFAQEYSIEHSSIEIEITERYIMESTTGNMDTLDELRACGFKISIDDFGTGYSSMSYLKKLPIDTIKIDKSFVDDLPVDSNNVAITKAIIALSHSLGYQTVAEGIETQEQEDFLAENLCDIGQGYFFSRPIDKKAFFKFMEK